MKFKLFASWTKEEVAAWLEKHGEPEGCIACGAIAGCCADYPNCAANPNWQWLGLLPDDGGDKHG